MNIFILDKDPVKSVQFHTNKHTIKMIIEYTQILCTVLHHTQQAPHFAYKPTHQTHPCVKWASKSLDNWLWLKEYTLILGEEYTYRYNKQHKSILIAQQLPEPTLPKIGLTPFAKCVPEEYKELDVVKAYREYFKHYKNHIKHYTRRPIPYWWR